MCEDLEFLGYANDSAVPQRMVPQRLDGTLNSNPEAKGHLRQIQIHQIVAKLAQDIVAGGLPV